MRPAPEWVCGPFTRWMHETNWPPGFEPQEIKRSQVDLNAAAARSRATALAKGHTGTICGLSAAAARGDVSKAVIQKAMRA